VSISSEFAIKKHSGGTVKALVAGALGGVAGYLLQLFVALPTLATAGGSYSVVETQLSNTSL
jgi:hypothetical protein